MDNSALNYCSSPPGQQTYLEGSKWSSAILRLIFNYSTVGNLRFSCAKNKSLVKFKGIWGNHYLEHVLCNHTNECFCKKHRALWSTDESNHQFYVWVPLAKVTYSAVMTVVMQKSTLIFEATHAALKTTSSPRMYFWTRQCETTLCTCYALAGVTYPPNMCKIIVQLRNVAAQLKRCFHMIPNCFW